MPFPPNRTSLKISRGRFGFGVAVALGLCLMFGADAWAVPVLSDTLQLGTLAQEQLFEDEEPDTGVPGQLPEISETTSIPKTGATGVVEEIIALHDPGTPDVSDVVFARITPGAATTDTDSLTVTLASDTNLEVPLFLGFFPPALDETGAIQDLSSNLTTLFDQTGLKVTLPAVLVSSDVEVPEPASLAILAAGLAGFALARRRRKA